MCHRRQTAAAASVSQLRGEGGNDIKRRRTADTVALARVKSVSVQEFTDVFRKSLCLCEI